MSFDQTPTIRNIIISHRFSVALEIAVCDFVNMIATNAYELLICLRKIAISTLFAYLIWNQNGSSKNMFALASALTPS